jgi:glycosyltransferase involved in cell wall biosynthesis
VITAAARPLRVALLVYRGNPTCGGQGVYVRHLSRGLGELGHQVTVFSGQPYPELAPGVELVKVPSLDLYRDSDPFRRPRLREVTDGTDLVELATMWTGGFAEPRTFAHRVRGELARRAGQFDIVHDDQSLGPGLLGLLADGWPLLASIHHPVTIDRRLDLAAAPTRGKRASIRRWYGFAAMQTRVARRLPRILTVSSSARADIVRELGVAARRVGVVPLGADTDVYRPYPAVRRIAGRIMTTASADVPLKGLVPLLEALAKVRVEHEEAHLVVVGRLRPESPVRATIDRLGLDRAVEFVAGESDAQLARRYAECQLAVVPSLYEGFSLPAVEAMAAGVPLVASSGGALPEVVGDDGAAALLVPPGDPSALTSAIEAVLADGRRAAAMGAAGRRRVLSHFTWSVAAARTAEEYRQVWAGVAAC